MAKLLSQDQIKAWLRENKFKDVASIENAFISEIKDVLQESLEEEMNGELGYSRYDWKKGY